MGPDFDESLDEQDQSEVFDEDNQSDDGGEMRTLEELPDVFDVTRAAGDEDDDEALIGEELDDDEIIDLEADAGSTDIEDDSLRDRMPEAFDDDSVGEEDIEEVYFEAETGLDVREDAESPNERSSEQVVASPEPDEPELEYDDDIDDEADEDSSVMESLRVSDEELERLGYRID